MRARLLTALIIVGLGVWFLAPAASWGQFKGKGFGGGFPGGGFPGGGFPGGGFPGGPGGGFGSRDPNQMFDFLSKGRGFFLISETRMLRDPLTKWAQEKGITDGRITREQFAAFNQSMQSQMGGGGFKPSFGPGPGPGPGPFPGGAPGGQSGPPANPTDALLGWAESEFKRRDTNGDGFLNMDEMPDSLRSDLGRWDTNRDNLINLEEFKNYFVARFQNGRRDKEGPVNPVTVIIEEEELDKRPVVFRAGKLPKELPSWFNELDTDKDGQVSLYEWRKGGKDLSEFASWDRNDDGLVMAEEVLFKQRNSQAQVASSSTGGNDDASPSFGKSFSGKMGGEDKGKGKGLWGGFKFKRPQ